MTPPKVWINTPGLKTILEEEVPLASRLLEEGRYPILIRGAPRTGKSHIRDQVWQTSGLEKLSEGVINCAAIPRDLAESLLFGHKKGSFTGANMDATGLLFDDSVPSKIVILEEIGELPKYVQAKLLVFFDSGFIMPVGAEWGEGKKSTLRVVATSNAVDDQFRPDFLARFWEVQVPPLYERREDIPYFLNHFLKGDERNLAAHELFYLMTHNWPGGVTEIEKVCIRLASHFLKKNDQKSNRTEHHDYVRKLVSDLSLFDARYPYVEFCHYALWHAEDDMIEKLFPHFCMEPRDPTPTYEIRDLIEEWKAWCYFFKVDPKSPSSIHEIIGDSITSYSSSELIYDFEMFNRNIDSICAVNTRLTYFVKFLISQKLWNEEGLTLLNDLRKYAFRDLLSEPDSEENGENDIESQRLSFFEKTTPGDYRNQFWEHQLEQGRTGKEIEIIYGINKKTAERHIRNTKKRQ